MNNKSLLQGLILMSALTLSACATFFDKDNTPPPTPLTAFTPEISPQRLWAATPNPGTGSDELALQPASYPHFLFTTSQKGRVTATDKNTGNTLWQTSTGFAIGAGPAADGRQVYVVGKKGEVAALDLQSGQLHWQKFLLTQVLSAPLVADHLVIVKSMEGQVIALSKETGEVEWRYQQIEPNLVLRAASQPLFIRSNILAGFANGNLVKLTLQGNLIWQKALAFPRGNFEIERMIDVDATPIFVNDTVYAATYQGQIAAVEWSTGNTRWTKDFSTYVGLAADTDQLYAVDTTGHVWAFDIRTGALRWQQTALAARRLTGVASMGHYLVVGDGEGYVHWLNKANGHFAARDHLGGGGLLATTLVEGSQVYFVTRKGLLAAYTL